MYVHTLHTQCACAYNQSIQKGFTPHVGGRPEQLQACKQIYKESLINVSILGHILDNRQ